MADPVTFTNYLTEALNEGFYFGGAVAQSVVPQVFDIAINGRTYMVDWDNARSDFTHRSTRMLRWQADASNEPGEESLNYDDLWRRSQSGWQHGAGQSYMDKGTSSVQSDRLRFNASKGVDPWTPFELSLLNDTRSIKSTANTNLQLLVAGSILYLTDGAHLYYTTDITGATPTWTAVASYTGGSIKSLATDGYNVYFTDGSDLWTCTTAGNTASKYIASFVCSLLGYAKGRLLAAQGASIYNVVTNSAPAALFTHPDANFTWTGFADGMSCLYAAGYSGSTSNIYRIGINTDATSLSQPIAAVPGMPTGEAVQSIYGYLGFVWLGTNKGFRFCEPDSSGNLKIGASTPSAVDASVLIGAAPLAFMGNDRFVYFGWTDYDADSTGLGRCDMTEFGDEDRQQLAYASDLMATSQGSVTSIAIFDSLVTFAVAGEGIFTQDTANLVASGTVDSGIADYDLTDPKIALKLTVTFAGGFAGSVMGYVALDDSGSFSLIGTHLSTEADNTGDQFEIGQLRAVKFETRWELVRSASTTNTGPTITHWTLRVQPAPDLTEVISVPLILADQYGDANDNVHNMDPVVELAILKELQTTRDVYVYQEFGTVYEVVLDEYEWRPSGPGQQRLSTSGLNGTFVAVQKVID